LDTAISDDDPLIRASAELSLRRANGVVVS
jgi:hypothetical protein